MLATGRYIGEGFDDSRLDTLFLAPPISWKGTLVQYTGRLHRPHPGKIEVRIYDYVDRDVPMLLIAALGGEVREGAGSRVVFELKGRRLYLQRPHPGRKATRYQADEVRGFLRSLEIQP